MTKRSTLRIAVAVLLIVALGAGVWAARAARQAPVKPPGLAAADKAYEQKSYAEALKGYEAAIKTDTLSPDRRDQVGYRIITALGKTEQWDRALAEGVAYVKAHRGTVWEPRALYWLGRLYVGVRHDGWRVGAKVFRGADVPQSSTGAAPERVYLQSQDLLNAVDALEAARVLYPAYRQANKTVAEEIQLDFDLATMVQQDQRSQEWLTKKSWLPPSDPSWRVDPGVDYSPTWPGPKKTLYLYNQIVALASQEQPDPHSAALALFGKALWLNQYRTMMESYASEYKGGKWVPIPYPYQDQSAEQAVRQLVRDYPEDPVRDQAQVTLEHFFETRSQFNAALAEMRSLLKAHPATKWRGEALSRIDSITREYLHVQSNAYNVTDKSAALTYQSRNMRNIKFRAYRVNLEDVISRSSRLKKAESSFTDTELDTNGPDAEKRLGTPVAEWSVSTKDRGDHQFRSAKIGTPLTEVGAYAVYAVSAKVCSATYVVVTDLAIVQKTERNSSLLLVADAHNGAPVKHVRILVKESWYDSGSIIHCEIMHVVTDADGLARIPLLRAPNRAMFRVQVLAYSGSRYALTQPQFNYYEGGDNTGEVKVYTTTDRSVYRPTQTVYFRELVMKTSNAYAKPAAGRTIHVQVSNPNGLAIFEKNLRADKFGAVSGEFALSAEAALGEYMIQTNVSGLENEPAEYGGNRFRVEEYKKPEFEVNVKPAAERVLLGEKTAAVVSARYYFGGPVANAKVTYRVYCNAYWQSYRFPQPFDFLYPYSNNGDYNTNYRNGPVIKQGEAITDARGDAKVEFATDAPNDNMKNYDLKFTVEADVQDASRRVISGDGEVKATKHDVAVFMNFPHGYATKGDRVDIEIMTLNPSDMPVSVNGTARVVRLPDAPDGKETVVYSTPLKTDAQGRAFLHWQNEKAGCFRAEYETMDSREQKVTGSQPVWVAGPELANSRFLYQGIGLMTANPYYEVGQKARLLIVTPVPNQTVLFTREAYNVIVESRVIHIAGRSLELREPLDRKDVPNTFFTVTAIRNGQALQATQEVFVPPVQQFADVTVTPDKDHYQPGEKAVLSITAKDHSGKPLSGEFALAVTDASLNYIQKDFSPEIRAYFYGNRWPDIILEAESLSIAFTTVDKDNQPTVTNNAHEWLLPEGMGQLMDWPGMQRNEYYYLYGGGGSIFGGYGSFNGSREKARQVSHGSAGGPPSIFGGDNSGVQAMRLTNNVTAPMAAIASAPMAQPGVESAGNGNRQGAGKSGGDLASPQLRTNFADTAFWSPAVVTDAAGQATVEVTWPDNLTTWRARAVGNTAEGQVGAGETKIITRKDIIVRLQAPRFFVERDTLTLTANVHNNLEKDARIKVTLNLGDATAELVTAANQGVIPVGAPKLALTEAQTWLNVKAGAEDRVDWTVHVLKEGQLHVRMTAQATNAADSTEMVIPVLVHGAERAITQSGRMKEEKVAEVNVPLPAERKAGSSELVVQLDPSLATLMMDALPYLADYPYGCVEQTMSRFLPSVVVAKALTSAGYNLEDLHKRALLLADREKGEPERQKIANSPYSYPGGRPGFLQTKPLSEALRWHRNPVYDTEMLKQMVSDGLTRLANFQHADGGWGWWTNDTSDQYMTAYVLYGLQTCRAADVAVDQNMITRGLNWLQARFLEQDDFHMMAYEARVLAMDKGRRAAVRALTVGRLYANRERLSAYSKALLALALHDLGENGLATVMLGNIETTAHVDVANGTASWGDSDNWWWRWYNNKVETNATVLEAYLAVEPKSPMPARMVKWLVNNRRGNIWNSTKETALAVYALADYARVNNEFAPDYTITLNLNGKVKRVYKVNRDNALFFDNRFVVPDELLQTGDNKLTVTKAGEGTVYWSAYSRYFSLEEPIRATSNEISVTRRYFRLTPLTAAGAPTEIPIDLKRPNPFLTGQYDLLTATGEWTGYRNTDVGPRYDRTPLADGETVKSGDQIEVELQIESKNDYEYLVFEDMKPSGCEPVELRSGGHEGAGVWSNMELRDQKVAFFVNWLPQGKRTLTYRLRAEIPGAFHVLPTNAYAMYAPDIRALSDETHVNISDK